MAFLCSTSRATAGTAMGTARLALQLRLLAKCCGRALLNCGLNCLFSLGMGSPGAEELDKLITDRPESCRRPSKQAEPEVSTLTQLAAAQGRISISQLQPQPIMTLSLQSLPLHHQLQTQARIAPDSPAPAQTPPLHTLPDVSHSPLPHHPMGRAPPDFLNVTADVNAEVDALDPSIMDFALQGREKAAGTGQGTAERVV